MSELATPEEQTAVPRQEARRFKEWLQPRPKPSGMDVECGLKHFAIITYAVPPERFEGMMPKRFRLDTVDIHGREMALLSVVPFIDVDFTSAVYPFPRFTMGQTNYRIYIVDQETNERAVWFLGTTLDSWTRIVPRYLWKLPWHAGKIRFDCLFDVDKGIYQRYGMTTKSEWAPAEVQLTQTEGNAFNLPGFPDTESALVYLTHPLAGFYYRTDGKLGTYRVWHDRLNVRPARLEHARFGLLERTGLVIGREFDRPHSVFVEPLNRFTIYLPPKVIS